MNEQRVWCVPRQGKKKIFYDLRFVHDGRMRSKCVGTDSKLAERKRIEMELALNAGSYQDLRRIPWSEFVVEHVATKSGRANRIEAERTLVEFGSLMRPRFPCDVRIGMVEAFVARLRDKGNSPATIAKKHRYVRHALKMAVRRGYAAVCATDGLILEKTPKRTLRILKAAEEPLLLAAARELHGSQMESFVRFVLATWGRLSEVTTLLWDDVDFDGASVLFRSTKSHEHRWIPLDPRSGMLDVLQRLRVRTLQDGGPFVRYRDKSNTNKKWHAIVAAAGIPAITVQDLRRTGITRALLAGMPLVSVQKLAGHRSITTTMQFYSEVSKQDLRDAVAKLTRSAAG